jgi:hypothetical protein
MRPRDLATGSNLDVPSQPAFATAALLIGAGRRTRSDSERAAVVTLARQLVVLGSNAIGSNLSYTIGEGTVMFWAGWTGCARGSSNTVRSRHVELDRQLAHPPAACSIRCSAGSRATSGSACTARRA